MLDHDNEPFKACFFQNPNPLICIQFSRIETLGIFLTIPPLLLIKSIDAKMDKSRQFISMR